MKIISGESKISFFEFTLEIPKDLVQAMKIYSKVKDGSIERPRSQWLELYKAMMVKHTT